MTRKLYWENPYLHETEASIIKKERKNGLFHITLDRTIFYPDMSGGQPGDIGTINGVSVIETVENEDRLTHILKSDIPGPKVKLSIQSDHRFDMMQQHSGQHLLSGVLYNLLGGETISFHLGKDYSSIDVTLSHMEQEEVDNAEALCNKIIQSNFQVKTYFVNQEKIKLLPVRKAPAVASNIRMVEIDGFDYSPCGGTHVNHTGELGLLKITKWEHYKGNLRIHFLTGLRAFMDYSSKFKSVRSISNLLSSSDDDIAVKVEKLFNDRTELEKEVRSGREEIISARSSMLVDGSERLGDLRVIRELYDNYDFKALSQLGSHISNNYERVVQIYGISNNGLGQFIISKSKDINLDLGNVYKQLSTEFKLKGGGNPNTVQGSVPTANLNLLLQRSMDIISQMLQSEN
ncbi:alanyl-tRNA editing protein [Gudongella sp. SC589]|jgi:alanyl-tRNA synthetase|uniref:alanyl-tRNA editing protein n=1 Tax=Gudongella sp. SC589 TaxID=3385990 RepID=UPI00390499FA